MRLRDVKVGDENACEGRLGKVKYISNSKSEVCPVLVRWNTGEESWNRVKDIKLSAPKESAWVPKVGDLVDVKKLGDGEFCNNEGVGLALLTGVDDETTTLFVEGLTFGPERKTGERLGRHGCWANIKDIRPHVPAKAEPPAKQEPVEGTPGWAEAMGKAGHKVAGDKFNNPCAFLEYKSKEWINQDGQFTRGPMNKNYYTSTVWRIVQPVDALEAAKRDAFDKWLKNGNVYESVEIGWKAALDTATRQKQRTPGETFEVVTEKALAYFQAKIGVDRFDDIARHIVKMFHGVDVAERAEPAETPEQVAIKALELAKDKIETETNAAIDKLNANVEKKFSAINEAVRILKGNK